MRLTEYCNGKCSRSCQFLKFCSVFLSIYSGEEVTSLLHLAVVFPSVRRDGTGSYNESTKAHYGEPTSLITEKEYCIHEWSGNDR